MTSILFGTSGWSYKDWVGPFYTKPVKMFSYYARFFNTSEINSTFYRYPSRDMMLGLSRVSPRNFVFSAKLPRLITHEKFLDVNLTVEGDLRRFLNLLIPLKTLGKLGCLLIQLPPRFVYERDHENFEGFLEMLPEGYEFAAEFRDPSWLRDAVWKLLKKHNVAYCVVDEPLLPPEVHVTADFAYFRWHGRGTRPWYNYCYSKEELERWRPRIEETQNKVEKIYGYFNNHFHGYAVENCIEILEMLNATNLEQIRVKEKISRHNTQLKLFEDEHAVEKRGVNEEITVESLLRKLTDDRRFKRGTKIKNDDLVIERLSKTMVKAKIRDYLVEINLIEKTVRHNCDDWRRGIGMKRVCKHLVKLFTLLSPTRSRAILEDLLQNRDDWSFQFIS